MMQGCQITLSDTAAYNLYALILSTLNLASPPQTGLGQRVFASNVAYLCLTLAINQSGNSGNFVSVQDQNGQEMNVLISGIPWIVFDTTNTIDLQGIKLQATADGAVVDVAINVK